MYYSIDIRSMCQAVAVKIYCRTDGELLEFCENKNSGELLALISPVRTSKDILAKI
jgi:hypothetical protein